MEVKEELFIIFGMEHYNPLGVIRTLGEYAIHPIFIALKGRSLVSSKSKYISKNHFVDTIEEGYRVLVEEYAGVYKDTGKKPFLITTDDDVQSYLDWHYEDLKESFILFNAGEKERITQYMDKKAILDLAKRCGLKVLDTCVVDRGTVPEDIEYPIITKSISPIVGGWKSDVHICASPTELKEAFEKIKSPKVLLQKFIDKKNEYCLDGFSVDKGRQMFIGTASTYNYLLKGYYSPYMTAHKFENEEIETGLKKMFEEIGFEGIFSIEFLIDKDDTYYFSEVNFRNSTWSYIATTLGMPLPLLWAKAMVTKKIDADWYRDIPKNYTAMVEPIDYGKRVETGKIEKADWLIDFKTANCLFYLDREDPEPFREMVKNWKLLS
jgi:D-aspartate ligase